MADHGVQAGCWALLGVFAVAQLVHTLRNENRWPFAAQNMFSQPAPAALRRVMVVLRDSLGGERVVFPYAVLPVEFFRAQRMLCQVYLEGDDPEFQDRFAVELLARLNQEPWAAFDEVEAAESPPTGASFVGFDLAVFEYAIDGYTPGADLAAIRRPLEVVYSCDLEPAPEPAPEEALA